MIHTVHRATLHCAVLLVSLYQIALSPVLYALGVRCRFHPSCSNYCLEAMRTHGVWTGAVLTARRLLRCHPWCEGGDDPVPPSRNNNRLTKE